MRDYGSEAWHLRPDSFDRQILSGEEKRARELDNLLRAFDLVQELAKAATPDASPLRPETVRDLHEQVIDGIYACSGRYRDRDDIEISGTPHKIPEPPYVPGLVAALCETLAGEWLEREGTWLAAFTMWRINWIHPFCGGNGRVSRLAALLVLRVKLDLPPLSRSIDSQLADSRRSDYLSALRDSDVAMEVTGGPNVDQLEDLIGELLTEALKHELDSNPQRKDQAGANSDSPLDPFA